MNRYTFGDILENGYQLKPNPFRFYIYLSSTDRYINVIGRDHETHQFSKKINKLDNVGNIFEDKILLDLFKLSKNDVIKEFNKLYCENDTTLLKNKIDSITVKFDKEED